jgi:hypothetical protein
MIVVTSSFKCRILRSPQLVVGRSHEQFSIKGFNAAPGVIAGGFYLRGSRRGTPEKMQWKGHGR